MAGRRRPVVCRRLSRGGWAGARGKAPAREIEGAGAVGIMSITVGHPDASGAGAEPWCNDSLGPALPFQEPRQHAPEDGPQSIRRPLRHPLGAKPVVRPFEPLGSHIAAALHHRLALAWEEDRARKAKEVQGLERELGGLLVHTPYLLLLSCQ